MTTLDLNQLFAVPGFDAPATTETGASAMLLSDRKIESVNDLHQVAKEQAEAGFRFLGTIIYWDLNACRIEHEALKEMADSCGFPKQYLPGKISPISAFKKARSLVEGPLKRNNQWVETVSQGGDPQIVVAVMQNHISSADEKVEAQQVDTIRFDKKTHAIQSQNGHEALHLFRSAYQQCLKHGRDDIRQCLTSMTDDLGFRLRNDGGMYFVPATFDDVVQAANTFITRIHGGNILYRLKQFETPGNVETLKANAQTMLGGEFEQLLKKMQDMISCTDLKDKSITHKEGEIATLRKRIKIFAQSVQVGEDLLRSELSKLEDILGICRQGHRAIAMNELESFFPQLKAEALPTPEAQEWGGMALDESFALPAFTLPAA